MSFRLAALLCLSGLAACHHENTRTAQDPTYVSRSSETPAEPGMRPASLEDPNPGTREPAEPARARPPGPEGGTRAEQPRPVAPNTSEQSPPADQPPANAAPDNTKVNERDRNDAALTPLDQGNNEADLKITQQIRQAVMADDSLSFTAKNVKIITMNGKVTLRGPVKTPQERSAIEAAARKVAGATQVDNQLEVKK
jgi:hyperosmotically inducible periplasmic protein